MESVQVELEMHSHIDDIHAAKRHAVEEQYSGLIATGHIYKSFGLTFVPRVLEYYGKQYNRVLDAGCGQCAVVTYLKRLKRDVYGVELSTAALQQELCPPLMAQGRVRQNTLAKIPWPDRHFDLLFSSDVLEHIPTFDIPEVIREMVRVTKGDVFMSISLRRAHDDPKPPAEPTIHVTVQPREWWDKQFKNVGCTVNQAALDSVLAGRDLNLEPWLFSYRCGDLASTPMVVKALTKDPLWTHNVPKGRLLKPRIIHRRFDGSPYFPNEAVITGRLGV